MSEKGAEIRSNISSSGSSIAVEDAFLKFNSPEEAAKHAKHVAEVSGLDEELIVQGAYALYFPDLITNEDDRLILQDEKTHRWRQNWKLYALAVTSAVSAGVQGIDESSVGGASLFYVKKFGIDSSSSYDATVQGLINSIPSLAAAVLGFIAVPSNHYIGRRATVFWASLLASASGLWQAFAPSWQMLLVGRLVMGISMGVKSSTVPIYTAECVPSNVRGGIVALWQTLTAFGVLWGFIVGAAFLDVGKDNWRYMLGSVFVPPLYVVATIFFFPESPRWLIQKKRYREALESFVKLRRSRLVAARDYYYAFSILAIEDEECKTRYGPHPKWYSTIVHFFTNKRSRAGAVAAGVMMVSQQFCGVGVLTFYISKILTNAGFSVRSALGGGCGFGAVGLAGDVTAIGLIDRFGRRSLCLWTFPVMVVFLLWIGFSFLAEGTTRLGLVLSGIYAYVFAFGLAAGPVPFTYSAEAFPLYLRNFGMSYASGVNWLFSWILAFTLPNMERSFQDIGIFCFYAGWCAVLYLLTYFLVPETKNYTLEELDLIFGFGVEAHAKFQWANFLALLGRRPRRRLIDAILHKDTIKE